jgi:hypothetical protein
MQRLLMCLTFLAAASILPAVAHADEKSQVVTAYAHANMAAEASTIDNVHMHLHHALNCLVGPDGDGFDASQADPCKADGSGAIPDARVPSRKAALEKAADKARAGIAATDFDQAIKAATDSAQEIADAINSAVPNPSP